MSQSVVMIVSNEHAPDPRVHRQARCLVEAGYRVDVLAWDRLKRQRNHENLDGVEVHRIHVPSDYNRRWRQVLPLGRFLRRAVRAALALQPDVVHCHDLDTLAGGWWVKHRLGVPLVYDAHEPYPLMMAALFPPPVVAGLRLYERTLMRRVDLTVTASTVLADEYRSGGFAAVTTVGNYQDLEAYRSLAPTKRQLARATFGVPEDEIVIGYIGMLGRDRALLPFLQSAALVAGIHFHVWGDGEQRDLLAAEASKHPNAAFHGWLPPDQVPAHFAALDAVYYGVDLSQPDAAHHASNTIGHALAAGKPVIATGLGDVGRMVADADCGILIEEPSPAAIAAAANRLRDPELHRRLGDNARRAAERTYNADRAAAELIKQYRRLLP